MHYNEPEYRDKLVAEGLKKNLPTFPCIRCSSWLDEYGVPVCKKGCGKWRAFMSDFFDHNENIDRLRKLMKENK